VICSCKNPLPRLCMHWDTGPLDSQQTWCSVAEACAQISEGSCTDPHSTMKGLKARLRGELINSSVCHPIEVAEGVAQNCRIRLGVGAWELEACNGEWLFSRWC